MKGLSWGFAAIGNAEWSGPRLRDVLTSLGVNEDEIKFKHVQVQILLRFLRLMPGFSSILFVLIRDFS